MTVIPTPSFPLFFTRKGMIKTSDVRPNAKIARRDIVEGWVEDGTLECRFVIAWLQFNNGEVVPTVRHPDLVPEMEEFLDAL